MPTRKPQLPVSRSSKVEPSERDLLMRLDEGQRHLMIRLESIEDRIQHAETSRSKLHERLDVQQKDIFVVGQVVAQHRDYMDMMNNKIDGNHEQVKPALDSWRELKTLGKWASIVLIGLGVTGAGALLVVREWALGFWTWVNR